MTVGDKREFWILFASMNNDKLAILLHNSTFNFLRRVNIISAKFKSNIMGTESSLLAVFNIDFTMINNNQSFTIKNLFNFNIVGFNKFKRKNQDTPDK